MLSPLPVDDSEMLGGVQSDLHVAQSRVKILESTVEKSTQQITALQKALDDKHAEVEVAKADSLLMKQDLALRDLENRNIQNAMAQVQRERDVAVSRTTAGFEEKAKDLEKEYHIKLQKVNQEWVAKLQTKEDVIQQSEQKSQDEGILRRKAELELNGEKRRMQRTLENALKQLENSQKDVVDRVLITNLIVSYFQRNKSKDVLDLISKILTFTDEQKQAVGLMARPGAFIESIFSSIGVAPPAPPEVEGDNLAELWVNFLMSEAEKGEQDGPSSASTPTSSRARKRMDSYSSDHDADNFTSTPLILSPNSQIRQTHSIGGKSTSEGMLRPPPILIQPIGNQQNGASYAGSGGGSLASSGRSTPSGDSGKLTLIPLSPAVTPTIQAKSYANNQR